LKKAVGFTVLAGVFLSPPVFAQQTVYADQVLSLTRGPGATHPDFLDPDSALGAPDYSDPLSTGFGTGAVSLGAGGEIVLRMAAPFAIGGTPSPDLIVYEIGPSQGGTAEATRVEISRDSITWTLVGIAPGGTSGLDLDALGFSQVDRFRYVRLTDLSLNAGQPAGGDMDAIAVLTAVPEPGAALMTLSGLVLLAVARRRRRAA